MVAAAVVVGVLLARERRSRAKKPLLRSRLAAAAGLVAGTLALGAVYRVMTEGPGRAAAPSFSGRVVARLASTRVEGDLSERLDLWRAALRMAQTRPITGWGPGMYPFTVALFRERGAPVGTPRALVAAGPSLRENAHNTYLTLLAELGVPGLTLYLAVLIAFLNAALRTLPTLRSTSRRFTLIGAVAGLASQMVCALGNPAWEFPECSFFLWAVLGLGAATAGFGERRPSAGEEMDRGRNGEEMGKKGAAIRPPEG
jgi:O-antigen ligase